VITTAAKHTFFDPDALRVMGEVYDLVLQKLNGATPPPRQAIRERVAARIVEVASAGETDPARLLTVVLEALRAGTD
jgi:hypothetical protein